MRRKTNKVERFFRNLITTFILVVLLVGTDFGKTENVVAVVRAPSISNIEVEDTKIAEDVVVEAKTVESTMVDTPKVVTLEEVRESIPVEEIEIKIILSEEQEENYRLQMREKLDSANAIISQINSLYSVENEGMVSKATLLLSEVQKILEEYPEIFSDIRAEYEESKNRLEQYKLMITSLMQKLPQVSATYTADMSVRIGFTKEELAYILKNVKSNGEKILKDEVLIYDIANSVVTTAEEYPINELFAISVMSLESGYFKSNYVLNHNNFGGMQVNGYAMNFDTRLDGIRAATKCIHQNLKGNNTITEINVTYCPPQEGEGFFWSDRVLCIMHEYLSAFNM